jgi:hypothetical protein
MEHATQRQLIIPFQYITWCIIYILTTLGQNAMTKFSHLFSDGIKKQAGIYDNMKPFSKSSIGSGRHILRHVGLHLQLHDLHCAYLKDVTLKSRVGIKMTGGFL